MPVKNGRLYQFLCDKLKCAPVALLLSLCARLCARAFLLVSACFPDKSVPDAEAARARVSAAFPKPALTREPAKPMPPPTLDLSIIAPVYNTGELLDPCLKSVYDQKTRFSYELILIDDGSEADTAERLSAYQDREDTVIVRQPNAGAAAARNRGLDMARGRYVMFLDADDLLLPGAIESLMDAALQGNADFVQGGWEYVGGAKQRFPSAVYAGDARMALIELPGMPWGKVMRRELFRALRFPSGFTSYVDSPIKCLTLRMSARCATIPDIVYAWRRNPGGITFKSKNTPRALQTYWIMEQMLEDSRALALPEDALFRAIFIRQMVSVAYDRLKGQEESVRRDVFSLACVFLAPMLRDERGLPFALRLARRAFLRRDFALWQRVAKLYAFTL